MDAAIPSPSQPTSGERHRRNTEDGRALVAAWQASGLSQPAFAAERGIPKQRISYWHRRLRAEPRLPAGAESSSVFVQVPAPERPVVGGCVVEWPDGLRLHVGTVADVAVLRAIVLALRGGAVAPC